MGRVNKNLETGYLADFHVYDPTTRNWTDLSGSASGSWPSARFLHGVAASGGRIYVFGGFSPGGILEKHYVIFERCQLMRFISRNALSGLPHL
jgi:hypothetical protein